MKLKKAIFYLLCIPGTIIDLSCYYFCLILRLIVAIDAALHHSWHLYRVWAKDVPYGYEFNDPRYFTAMEIFNLTRLGKTIDYDARRVKD